MSSASAVLALARWRNALVAAAGVVIGAWWAAGALGGARTLLAAAAAVFLTAFANAVNDYADRDIDRVAHPGRPLPSGALSPGDALAVAAAAAAGAVLCAFLAGPALGALTLPVLALMAEYSRRVKRLGLAGNLLVAGLASLPFLYGAWTVGRPAAALPLLALAVPLHLAREIAKDIEDADADAPWRRTLPVAHGVGAARVGFGVALAAWVAALVPFALGRPRFALAIVPALVLSALAARHILAGRRGGPALLKSAMLWSMASLAVAR